MGLKDKLIIGSCAEYTHQRYSKEDVDEAVEDIKLLFCNGQPLKDRPCNKCVSCKLIKEVFE